MNLTWRWLLASVRRWGWLLVLGAALGAISTPIRLARGDVYSSTSTMLVTSALTVSPDLSVASRMSPLLATLITFKPTLERAVALGAQPADVQLLRASITARAVAGTPAVEITVRGGTPEQVVRTIEAVTRAVAEGVPGFPGTVTPLETTFGALLVRDRFRDEGLGAWFGLQIAISAAVLVAAAGAAATAVERAPVIAGLRRPVRRRGSGRNELESWLADAPEAIEGILWLRTAVSRYFTGRDGVGGIVCVTGTRPNVGASGAAAALAVVFARAGWRTLLLDANLHHPVQHELLRAPRVAGFAELLAGEAVDAQDTRFPMLRVLTAGRALLPSEHPSDLVARTDLAGRLRSLADGTEVVVVDAAANDLAALPIIAQAADVTLVLRPTGERGGSAALEQLHAQSRPVCIVAIGDDGDRAPGSSRVRSRRFGVGTL